MKNYIIIGGSDGIGRAIVQTLRSDHNHNVWATYHSSSDEQIISDSRYFELDVNAEKMDLDSLPDVLDGIVYCPGNIKLKPFHRIKPADFISDYQLQVLGAVKVIQFLLPRLRRAENAAVVLFSSVAVQKGFNFHSLISSSKGAIEGLTKALAAEYAPKIRFNCIAPSLTDTTLSEGLLNTDTKREAHSQRHPLKRIGQPKDIAAMASFLLTEQSSWITGQIMHVDGGMSNINL